MFFAAEILSWLLIIISAWIGLWLLLAAYFAPTLRALWHEPVLRHPILIVESDDWGAGPSKQAQALQKLIELLSRFHDHTGHPPVMTLAMILAVADGVAIRANGTYQRRTLEEPLYAPIRKTITEGIEKRVFAIQLHGLEHYWPETLISSQDKTVQRWLMEETPQATEPLPSHLQSRWIDASTLPSRPLPDTAIQPAVREEVALYRKIFSQLPRTVVPPTFVWTDAVESVWARQGIEYVVTPGRQNTSRDAHGKPAATANRIRNGERNNNVTYIVRDDYFEPMLGHTAEKALAALTHKTRLGRPCLLETHRFNFVGEDEQVQRSMAELSRLLQKALQTTPELRFISTEALGLAMQTKDPEWVEHHLGRRLTVMAKRIAEVPRLGKLSRLTGLLTLTRLAAAMLGYKSAAPAT